MQISLRRNNFLFVYLLTQSYLLQKTIKVTSVIYLENEKMTIILRHLIQTDTFFNHMCVSGRIKCITKFDASSTLIKRKMDRLSVRLRSLHTALTAVVDLYSPKNTTGLWWLLCGDAVGWQLQLVSSFLLFIYALGFGNPAVFVDGAILLFSLGPILLLQHAILENRAVEMASRAREVLQRIEEIVDECEHEDAISLDAFTFIPNSRCVSNVVLNSAEVVEVSLDSMLPAQLLLCGDEIRQPPDDWIVSKYCRASTKEFIGHVNVVNKTPSAVQLEAVLTKEPHPENFYEFRHKAVVNILQKMLMGALILSVLSSILHVVLASNGRYFENLVLRNVDVCLPILPLSFSLLSILLQVSCNAYVGALIHVMQSSSGGDGGEVATPHSARRRPSRRTWLHRICGVLQPRTDSDNDRVSMLAAADAADASAPSHARGGIRASGVSGRAASTGLWGRVSAASPLGSGARFPVSAGLWWAHVMERLRQLLTCSCSAPRDVLGGVSGAGRGGAGSRGDIVGRLGSATVLSFADLHGVLADPVASPRHVFLLTPPPASPSSSHDSTEARCASGAGAGAGVGFGRWAQRGGADMGTVAGAGRGSMVRRGSGDGRGGWSVLEVMVDGAGPGGTGAVAFEDPAAAAEHLAQLKPLGLNCLLNSNAHAHRHALAVEETLRAMARAAHEPHRGDARGLGRGRGGSFMGLASCDTADASRMLAPVTHAEMRGE